MSARGIYMNNLVGCYVGTTMSGANRFDLMTEDHAACVWVRVKGPSGGSNSVGNPVLAVVSTTWVPDHGANARVVSTDSRYGASPWVQAGYSQIGTGADTNNGDTGDAVATDEDWFWFVSYKYSTGVFTFMYGKDGAGALTTFNSGAYTFTDSRIDEIGFGGSTLINDQYSNVEVTCARAWKRAFSAAEALAEMKSATPVKISTSAPDFLWGSWPLTSTTDLADTSGNGRDLTRTGTSVNGTMDPVDIQATGSACTFYGRLIA